MKYPTYKSNMINNLGSDLEMESLEVKNKQYTENSMDKQKSNVSKCLQYFIQLIYLSCGTWIILTAYYISNHSVFSLSTERVTNNIFIPMCYSGISMILISVANLHYFKNLYEKRSNNMVQRIAFILANFAVVSGASIYSSYKPSFLEDMIDQG